MTPTEIVLDTGALIALERGDALVRGYVLLAERGHVVLTTSSAVVAQAWRGGARQARLSRFLNSDLVAEWPLASATSRRIGALAATTGASDVIDGHVVVLAIERDALIMTSDPHDMKRWGIAAERLIRC